ncbi:MAG TPA: hypothetical protein ENN20_02965 [Candidatus Marinimicrobia bacterium]|nr:hypothetical protein [Candidatus Neomarinimicrobiota bacterium]
MIYHIEKSIINIPLFVLIMTLPFACFRQPEQERYQALQAIDATEQRLAETCRFIADYPRSDSLFPAIRQVLKLLNESGQEDRLLEFIINQHLAQSNPEIRTCLDRQLMERLLPDSVQRQRYAADLAHYRLEYDDPLALALATLPRLQIRSPDDSLRRRIIRQLSDHILKSDYTDFGNFKTISEQLLEMDDSLLVPLSNQFLIAAIDRCTPVTIKKYHPDITQPDSLLNQFYYSCFTALAWNAYRQRRFEYALNLISQASKYGDLAAQDGYIILGAAQAECDELKQGWAHLLTGLVLNPGAEKESPAIKNIYTTLFRRIRSPREDPTRFLNQYRRSHR